MRAPTEFGSDVTQWEDAVFMAASYFTVVSGRNPWARRRDVYRSWIEAKLAAGNDPTKMIYAVTEAHNSVMLPRSLWNHYDQLEGRGGVS